MNITHRRFSFATALGALFMAACGGSKVPARLTTFDGHQVEVATAGSGGNATVVFEAGLGNDWTPWHEVANRVS